MLLELVCKEGLKRAAEKILEKVQMNAAMNPAMLGKILKCVNGSNSDELKEALMSKISELDNKMEIKGEKKNKKSIKVDNSYKAPKYTDEDGNKPSSKLRLARDNGYNENVRIPNDRTDNLDIKNKPKEDSKMFERVQMVDSSKEKRLGN